MCSGEIQIEVALKMDGKTGVMKTLRTKIDEECQRCCCKFNEYQYLKEQNY